MKRRKLRKTGENIQNALEVPNDGNRIFFKTWKHKKGREKEKTISLLLRKRKQEIEGIISLEM